MQARPIVNARATHPYSPTPNLNYNPSIKCNGTRKTPRCLYKIQVAIRASEVSLLWSLIAICEIKFYIPFVNPNAVIKYKTNCVQTTEGTFMQGQMISTNFLQLFELKFNFLSGKVSAQPNSLPSRVTLGAFLPVNLTFTAVKFTEGYFV